MTLPDDYARCHDARCEVSEYCQRWVDRDKGGKRTVHATTLRQGWEPHDEFCAASIPTGSSEGDPDHSHNWW